MRDLNMVHTETYVSTESVVIWRSTNKIKII